MQVVFTVHYFSIRLVVNVATRSYDLWRKKIRTPPPPSPTFIFICLFNEDSTSHGFYFLFFIGIDRNSGNEASLFYFIFFGQFVRDEKKFCLSMNFLNCNHNCNFLFFFLFVKRASNSNFHCVPVSPGITYFIFFSEIINKY